MDGAEGALKGTAIAILGPSRARLDRLGEWFAAEYEPLLRFAYLVAGDRAEAEDLVQEAFVRVYRAGGRAEQEGIGAYARRTILNLRRSAWRRAQRERRFQTAQPEESPAVPDPAERDEIWRALAGLSRRQRAVVALRFYEDMSEAQIAATLGMSAGAVKKHASRAMQRLREGLGRES